MHKMVTGAEGLLSLTYFKDLNSGQKEAVLHRDGPMLVTAGPGSGKTHVITARLIYMMLHYQIPPEKILVITFTKEAAISMKNRFHAAYQKIAAQLQLSFNEASISFGTFHSFYYQIIRSIPMYSKFRLIYEKEKKYILSQTIKKMQQNSDSSIKTKMSSDDMEDWVSEKLTAISYYKNTDNVTSAADMAHMNIEEFMELTKEYDEEKRKRSVLDFDDMLYLCMKLLQEDGVLLKKWGQRFDYYLVDEFQDCNPVQYRLLKLLASESKNNIFVVGDDDQSIYGFRGADSMVLQEFSKDFPKAAHAALEINYRCGWDIVQASSKVIRENKMRLKKKLTANGAQSKEEQVSIKKWPSRDEMNKYMISMFKALDERELSKHAVLFRTNQETQMFALALLRENISFLIKDKTISIYEHFLVKDMMSFLQAAHGNRERKVFLRILNKPRTHIGRESLETEVVDFERMKTFYRDPFMKNPKALEDILRLETHLERLKQLKPGLGIRYIRMAMNYEKYLVTRAGGNEPLLASWRELLDWLQEEAAGYKSLEEWEEYQKEYARKLKLENSAGERTGKGVHLMTMHASKGLEFEHCYILNVNEGVIPKYQRGQKLTMHQLEEERRIFYVGMTRAKKTLELHYLTGTKERPKFPSRFIHRLTE